MSRVYQKFRQFDFDSLILPSAPKKVAHFKNGQKLPKIISSLFSPTLNLNP